MSRNTGVEKRLNFSYQENIFVLCFTIEQVGFKRKENEWIFTYHKNCFKKKGGGGK
jgi:phage-related protein